MSKNPFKSTAMTRYAWTAVFFCSIGSTASYVQYVLRNYYVLYRDGNGLTDVQMGLIISAMSVAQVISYFYGGIISDIFRPKTLLTFAYVSYGVASLILFTNPGFVASIVIFVLFAMTPLWAPMVKFIASTTPREATAEIFGWLDSFSGITGLIIGVVTTWAVGVFGTGASVRIMCAMYCAMAFISLAGIFIMESSAKKAGIYTEATKEEKKEEDKFTFKKLLQLLTDPSQWLIWGSLVCIYTAYLGVTYMSPLLTDYFGVSATAVTALDTFRNNVVTLIAPVISGIIATRIGALKTFFICLGFYLSSMIIILLCPWENAFWPIGFLVVIMLGCALRGRAPLSTAMFTQVRTPWALFATTVAMTSAINSIPDAFAYTLCGLAIENYGITGYRYIFITCAALACIGFILALILDRRLKAGKDSEWHFSQNTLSDASK